VRLDPATQTLTGTEQITLHNNSPDALNQVRLRLDRQRDRRPPEPGSGARSSASPPQAAGPRCAH